MVYLLHFNKKFHHAQHYIGFTDNLNDRIKRHEAGDGAKIIAAIIRNKITFFVARIWPDGDRKFERKLKRFKKAKRFCPACKSIPDKLNGADFFIIEKEGA